jgi:hypothetical protein
VFWLRNVYCVLFEDRVYSQKVKEKIKTLSLAHETIVDTLELDTFVFCSALFDELVSSSFDYLFYILS